LIIWTENEKPCFSQLFILTVIVEVSNGLPTEDKNTHTFTAKVSFLNQQSQCRAWDLCRTFLNARSFFLFAT